MLGGPNQVLMILPQPMVLNDIGRIEMAEHGTRIRLTRQSTYADRFRAYKVLIDGEDAGRIKNGESLYIPVSPGQHSIHLKIDWCRSSGVEFMAKEGKEIDFECGSSLAGWRILLAPIYNTILWNEYLWIRQLD